MEKESKLIFTPQLARYLIKKGFYVMDIKPCREDKNKTIFVFRIENGLNEAINNYINYVE